MIYLLIEKTSKRHVMLLTLITVLFFAGVISSFVQFFLKLESSNITGAIWIALLISSVIGWCIQWQSSQRTLVILTVTLWMIQIACRYWSSVLQKN